MVSLLTPPYPSISSTRSEPLRSGHTYFRPSSLHSTVAAERHSWLPTSGPPPHSHRASGHTSSLRTKIESHSLRQHTHVFVKGETLLVTASQPHTLHAPNPFPHSVYTPDGTSRALHLFTVPVLLRRDLASVAAAAINNNFIISLEKRKECAHNARDTGDKTRAG